MKNDVTGMNLFMVNALLFFTTISTVSVDGRVVHWTSESNWRWFLRVESKKQSVLTPANHTVNITTENNELRSEDVWNIWLPSDSVEVTFQSLFLQVSHTLASDVTLMPLGKGETVLKLEQIGKGLGEHVIKSLKTINNFLRKTHSTHITLKELLKTLRTIVGSSNTIHSTGGGNDETHSVTEIILLDEEQTEPTPSISKEKDGNAANFPKRILLKRQAVELENSSATEAAVPTLGFSENGTSVVLHENLHSGSTIVLTSENVSSVPEKTTKSENMNAVEEPSSLNRNENKENSSIFVTIIMGSSRTHDPTNSSSPSNTLTDKPTSDINSINQEKPNSTTSLFIPTESAVTSQHALTENNTIDSLKMEIDVPVPAIFSPNIPSNMDVINDNTSQIVFTEANKSDAVFNRASSTIAATDSTPTPVVPPFQNESIKPEHLKIANDSNDVKETRNNTRQPSFITTLQSSTIDQLLIPKNDNTIMNFSSEQMTTLETIQAVNVSLVSEFQSTETSRREKIRATTILNNSTGLTHLNDTKHSNDTSVEKSHLTTSTATIEVTGTKSGLVVTKLLNENRSSNATMPSMKPSHVDDATEVLGVHQTFETTNSTVPSRKTSHVDDVGHQTTEIGTSHPVNASTLTSILPISRAVERTSTMFFVTENVSTILTTFTQMPTVVTTIIAENHTTKGTTETLQAVTGKIGDQQNKTEHNNINPGTTMQTKEHLLTTETLYTIESSSKVNEVTSVLGETTVSSSNVEHESTKSEYLNMSSTPSSSNTKYESTKMEYSNASATASIKVLPTPRTNYTRGHKTIVDYLKPKLTMEEAIKNKFPTFGGKVKGGSAKGPSIKTHRTKTNRRKYGRKLEDEEEDSEFGSYSLEDLLMDDNKTLSTNSSAHNHRLSEFGRMSGTFLEEEDLEKSFSTPPVTKTIDLCTAARQCNITLNERCISREIHKVCDCGRAYERNKQTGVCEPVLVVSNDSCLNKELTYCSPHADCIRDSKNQSGYYCTCRHNYVDVSPAVDLYPGEECQAYELCSGYCKHSGVCVTKDGDMFCSCGLGYSGYRCEFFILNTSLLVTAGIVTAIVVCCLLPLIFACCLRKCGHFQVTHKPCQARTLSMRPVLNRSFTSV